MDFLGAGMLILVVVIGSIVFWSLLQNSVIINPSIMGLFSWWLSCVVGTAVVLYLAFDILFGVVSWAFDLVKNYYLYIIGAVVIVGGIGFLGGKANKENA